MCRKHDICFGIHSISTSSNTALAERIQNAHISLARCVASCDYDARVLKTKQKYTRWQWALLILCSSVSILANNDSNESRSYTLHGPQEMVAYHLSAFVISWPNGISVSSPSAHTHIHTRTREHIMLDSSLPFDTDTQLFTFVVVCCSLLLIWLYMYIGLVVCWSSPRSRNRYRQKCERIDGKSIAMWWIISIVFVAFIRRLMCVVRKYVCRTQLNYFFLFRHKFRTDVWKIKCNAKRWSLAVVLVQTNEIPIYWNYVHHSLLV